ncbi:hypothetical protein Ddye_027654 [Dipteronia dyeriana]|uniref:Wax synthase domain-containing protein n=1 Tax=Dipteronia dyeriana TaxID=168575 RepID=A0AAD9TQF9_9ROSI|nr:hypothetical protein Ddye_027654 [Dipteronia dyeriana]
MDLEVKNLIKVMFQASISLSYCYFISSKIPKGLQRLLSILPIVSFFIYLPLNLSSFHLTFTAASNLVWYANFKLLLFAFDHGPLSLSPPSSSSSSSSPSSSSSSSPTNVLHFIMVASLPIKIKPHRPSHQKTKNNNNTRYLERFLKGGLFIFKVLLFVVVLKAYKYKEYLHDYVVMSLYCCHVYLQLEFSIAFSVIPARFLGFEIEPQFNEPYLATSLQDFWGRRWNLMVVGILRPTVYEPLRYVFTPIIGRELVVFPCIMAVFTVSGLMHEVIFYYVSRTPPTWEQLWYFVLHGAFLVVEITIKKKVADRHWRLRRVVLRPLPVVFVAVTGSWLFFPVFLRHNVMERVMDEIFILVDFIKNTVI